MNDSEKDAFFDEVERDIEKQFHTVRQALALGADSDQAEELLKVYREADIALTNLYHNAQKGVEPRRAASKAKQRGFLGSQPQVMGAALTVLQRHVESGTAKVSKAGITLPDKFRAEVQSQLALDGVAIGKSQVHKILGDRYFNFKLAMKYLEHNAKSKEPG